MKKRTVVITIVVIGLLIVAFIGGSVMAQGDATNSSKDSYVPAPAYSQDEAAPGSAIQVNGAVVSSSSDGSIPSGINAALSEENPSVAAAQNNTAAGSSASIDVIPGAAGAPINESAPNETSLAVSTVSVIGEPNAPTYNNSIRYVGSTFKPRTNDVNYDTSGSGGCVYVTGGNSSTVWNVPLTLPQSARVEYLRMYFYDNDASNTLGGWFSKYDLYGGLIQEWYVASVDGGYSYTDVAITPNETINYNTYSYVLNMRPIGTGSNLMFCGFRVFYQYIFGLNFLPAISK
jgi:hypothetical protein